MDDNARPDAAAVVNDVDVDEVDVDDANGDEVYVDGADAADQSMLPPPSVDSSPNGESSSDEAAATTASPGPPEAGEVERPDGQPDTATAVAEPPALDDVPPPPVRPAPPYGIAALAMFVFLVSLGYVATALYPSWVIDHPVGLIALSARMRNLLGALGTGMPLPVFFVVGGVRLAIAYVTCHLIGRAYGERIYYVFGRYLGVTSDQIESVNSMFDKVEWLVVPWFVGSNLIAAVTGVRRMEWRRLAILTGIGIAIRLIVLWVMSVMFERQLDIILDWIARYQRPLLLVSIALAVATVAFNLRKGKNFEM